MTTLSFAQKIAQFKTAYETYNNIGDADSALDLAQVSAHLLASMAIGGIAGKLAWTKYTAIDRVDDVVSGNVRGERFSKTSIGYKKAAKSFLFNLAAAELTSQKIDDIIESGFVLDLYEWARGKTTDFFEDTDNAINDFIDYVEGGINSLIAQLEEVWDDFKEKTINIFIELWEETGEIADGVFDSVNSFFEDALAWIPPRDPLTLDLDGDGIETIAADGTILFDHDGDGTKTATG